VYTLRASMKTKSFSEFTLLKPRDAIAQVFESRFATCKPGTPRKLSAIVVAPERRMSSFVTTVTAAAADPSRST
jgi:hypothetical protein